MQRDTLAEHFVEQVGCAVNHFGLLNEELIAVQPESAGTPCCKPARRSTTSSLRMAAAQH
jgi:hypothetical protein